MAENKKAVDLSLLDHILLQHEGDSTSLITILQEAQEIYGYLPIEVQQMIAEGLNIPLAEVYGVVTFYSFFSLEPKGKYIIGCCLGTACYVKGAQLVLDELEKVLGVPAGSTTPDGLFTLNATRCLGACGLAPVIMVNDDVYGRLTPDQVAGVIEKYRN